MSASTGPLTGLNILLAAVEQEEQPIKRPHSKVSTTAQLVAGSDAREQLRKQRKIWEQSSGFNFLPITTRQLPSKPLTNRASVTLANPPLFPPLTQEPTHRTKILAARATLAALTRLSKEKDPKSGDYAKVKCDEGDCHVNLALLEEDPKQARESYLKALVCFSGVNSPHYPRELRLKATCSIGACNLKIGDLEKNPEEKLNRFRLALAYYSLIKDIQHPQFRTYIQNQIKACEEKISSCRI